MVSKRKACLDTNLVVDLLLVRKRYKKVEELTASMELCASAYAIGTVYYLAGRVRKVDNTAFRKFVNDITILPVDSNVLQKSFDIVDDNDLEDAIQIAACLEAGVDIFVTADKQLAKLYSGMIKVELIA